mgnify:CR=1 FL=1|jgi:hypothetical protein
MRDEMVSWEQCERGSANRRDEAGVLSYVLVEQAASSPDWAEGLNSSDPQEVREYGLELAREIGACTFEAGQTKAGGMRWGYVGAGAALGAGIMYFFSKVRR